MKKSIISLCIIVLFIGVSGAMGWYPVALVNGAPIFARTWHTLIRASQQYADMELQKQGKPPLDFDAYENRAMLDQGRKDILTALIEDVVVKANGTAMISDFGSRVDKKVSEALRSNQNITDDATERLYGLSLNDFKQFVVIPQARKDVITEELDSTSSQSLDQWLRAAEKNARVRLFFVPYHWNGERVE